MDREVEQRDRLHGAEDRGGPGHVVLHLEHAGRGLQREAPRVERDALADQGDRALALARRRRPVLEHDHARRAFAALAHGEDRAHASLLHLGDVHDRALEADRAGHLAGLAGQGFRVERVRRLVREVARVELALGDLDRPLGRGAERGEPLDLAYGHDPQPLRRGLLLAPAALVLVEAIAAEQGALGDDRNRALGRDPCARREHERDATVLLAIRLAANVVGFSPRRVIGITTVSALTSPAPPASIWIRMVMGSLLP